jgi:hypothetical protein
MLAAGSTRLFALHCAGALSNRIRDVGWRRNV